MSIIDDRVAPALGLAAHLGRGMRRIGTDAAIGRLRRTPRTVADLDAAALARLIGRPVASVEVIEELRSSDDPLVKKTAESFVEALNLVRTRTENIDSPYVQARQKFLKY